MRFVRSILITGALLLSGCSGGNDQENEQASRHIGVLPAELTLPMPLPSGTEVDVTAPDLHQRIRILSDDRFEGRGPGSLVGEKTADWLAAEFERIGITPGGTNQSWFQPVDMIEQTLDPNASQFAFVSADDVISLDLGKDAVMWTKRQNSDEFEFDASEMVFVGYGIVAPEYGWDDYEGIDVTGKTVIMLINDPGYARGDELFRGEAMTYYGRWTYKFEEAARQGATGAIIIHETAPASYGWDVVSNSWSGAQADRVRSDGGKDRALFESWITQGVASELFRRAGLDFPTLKASAESQDFEPVVLEGYSARGRLVQSLSHKQSRNVVGILPGRERPNEYVLLVAHWDHLGLKDGPNDALPEDGLNRDMIFNGAVDNATGIASMLEVAEAIAAAPPQRSVLFLAVTLEESGLLGSAQFADAPSIPLDQIVAGLNIDGLLPMGRTYDMTVIGYGASELEDILAHHLAEQGRKILPDQKPEAGSFYRSDHISFAKKGIPMLYADNGVEKRDGGFAAGQAFMEFYRTQRYHKPSDEYDPEWDVAGMVEDTLVFLAVTRTLAESDDWPTWYPGNEFEALRAEARNTSGR